MNFIKLTFLVLIIAISTPSYAAFKVEYKALMDGKITMLVPKYLDVMTDKKKAKFYPKAATPFLAYSDLIGTTRLSFNYSKANIAIEPAKALDEFLTLTMQLHGTLSKTTIFYGKEIADINGAKMGYIEFYNPARHRTGYRLIFAIVLEGKLLTVTFTCPENKIDELRPYAWQMMNSLYIN